MSTTRPLFLLEIFWKHFAISRLPHIIALFSLERRIFLSSDGRTWTILADPYANPTLDHHTAAYDVERRQYLIFGGKNYRFTALGSLFELQGGRLVERAREGPSPRYNSAMVYDSKRSQMVVFGGRVRDDDTFIAMSDTWIWNGSTWTEMTPGE